MTVGTSPLKTLNAKIIACNDCARLREHCIEVARVRRRAYSDWEYWGRPVPSFGDEHARVLTLGLAPGAHGSNRTGRMFTGDGSGDFLFPVLHEAGFASQAGSISREDGMKLNGMWISAVVRCAPPANKPLPVEQRQCSHWLDEEMALLTQLRVVVCLGRIAFDGFLAFQMRAGKLTSRSGFVFAHGAEYKLPDGLSLIASYHPSLQNTNTGKLTRPMFLNVFKSARKLAESE